MEAVNAFAMPTMRAVAAKMFIKSASDRIEYQDKAVCVIRTKMNQTRTAEG